MVNKLILFIYDDDAPSDLSRWTMHQVRGQEAVLEMNSDVYTRSDAD